MRGKACSLLVKIASLLLALTALALTALALTGPVMAQDYPNKPVRLIIPFPPGGSNDVVGRMILRAAVGAIGSASRWWSTTAAWRRRRDRLRSGGKRASRRLHAAGHRDRARRSVPGSTS